MKRDIPLRIEPVGDSPFIMIVVLNQEAI